MADGRIHFRCPYCNKGINVAETHAGKRAKCPACGMALEIPASEPASDFDTLLDKCTAELKAKTAAHDGTWHLGTADWDIDQDAGTITFTAPNGTVATAAVQIIGTFNTADNTWLWAWDHPSVEPALQEHAKLCRAYGEKHGIDVLKYQKFEGSNKDDGWQLTALACHLAGAQGGYCGPSGSTLVFVTFGEVTLRKGK